MKVRFKRLIGSALLPEKAHPSDAGYDLRAVSKAYDICDNIVYGTGLAFEIPEGHVGLLFPRSSIANYDLDLSNSVGVIDCHYRGEVMMKFKRYDSLNPHEYRIGDKIGQIIIIPYPEIEFEEADELSESDRGTGGYGSSGN